MADGKPLVELFVKAAPSDRKEKGPCLIAQQWFMSLYCLVEKGLIDLRVTPMTMDLPPENYVKLNAARHLPIAWIESGILCGEDARGIVIPSSESLEALFVKLKCPNLNPSLNETDVRAAEKVFENLYVSLMQYIKNDLRKPLLSALTTLDHYLSSAAKPYALGSEVSYVDCQLMPKLQHVRIAGKAYKDFDIPGDLIHVWKYISHMYELKAFICSCPATRDVLMHFDEKAPLPKEIRPSLMDSEILKTLPPHLSSQPVNGNRK